MFCLWVSHCSFRSVLFQNTQTCIPTVDKPPLRHDQSTRHHTQSPIDPTDRAPPGLPWGPLLPQALVVHLKMTHRNGWHGLRLIQLSHSSFCSLKLHKTPQSKVTERHYSHIPEKTWSTRQTCQAHTAWVRHDWGMIETWAFQREEPWPILCRQPLTCPEGILLRLMLL